MRYDFEIGSTSDTVNLESLATPVEPPDFTYTEWALEVKLANGQVRGMGFPQASWIWGYITSAERTMLRSFCSGKSAMVYIKTPDNSRTYKKFQAVMVWPAGEDPTADILPDFTIEFRHLVEVE